MQHLVVDLFLLFLGITNGTSHANNSWLRWWYGHHLFVGLLRGPVEGDRNHVSFGRVKRVVRVQLVLLRGPRLGLRLFIRLVPYVLNGQRQRHFQFVLLLLEGLPHVLGRRDRI